MSSSAKSLQSRTSSPLTSSSTCKASFAHSVEPQSRYVYFAGDNGESSACSNTSVASNYSGNGNVSFSKGE